MSILDFCKLGQATLGLVCKSPDYIDFAFEDEGWVKDEIVALAKHRAFRRFFDACSSDYHKHDAEFEQYRIELERIKSASVDTADLDWFDEETFFDSDDQQEYLLGDWIAQGCLHLFAAEKKIGKSTCTFSMVKPLISGEAWYPLKNRPYCADGTTY